MTPKFKKLVEHYKSASIDADDLKSVTLAQWILESGRGGSTLAEAHNNFAGLKFRAEMSNHAEPVDISVHDGEDTYCKFESIEDFVTGYWKFIDRAVYSGWREFQNDPAGYIRFLKSKGYAADENYASKVLELLGEADQLLGTQVELDPFALSTTKIAIVVGHNENAKGARAGTPINDFEFDYNNIVAGEMKTLASEYNCVAEIFHRQPSTSNTIEIREVYQKVDEWGATAIIELHFNSHDSSANGTEVLVADSIDAKVIATAVQEELVETLELKDRKVKVKGPADRGGKSLYASESPTILVEPFFGSHKPDRLRAAEIGQREIARSYLRGLQTGLQQFVG